MVTINEQVVGLTDTLVAFNSLALISSSTCAVVGLPGDPIDFHFANGLQLFSSIRYIVAVVKYFLQISLLLLSILVVSFTNMTLTERSDSVPLILQKLKKTLMPLFDENWSFKRTLLLLFILSLDVTNAAIRVPFPLGFGGRVDEPLVTSFVVCVRPASEVFK